MELTTLSVMVHNTNHASVLASPAEAMDANATTQWTTLSFWTDEFGLWFTFVFEVGINGFLCLLGIVNNIITIVVFVKMGFKETTNISMTAIASWDLLKNLSLLAKRGVPFLAYFPIPMDVATVFSAISNSSFDEIANISAHASSMLAVYVAIERCMCVSMPFSVRSLLTRKTSIAACPAISVFVIGSYAVDFFTDYVVYKQWRTRDNHTVTVMLSFASSFRRENSWAMDFIRILNFIYPTVAFIIMSICTVIIVSHLKQSSKFRSTNTSDGSRQLSTRDRKITKMLVVIIVFYLIYVVPLLGYYFVIPLLPYIRRLDEFLLRFAIFFSLINSSVNLYIFYFMSSEFKRTLRRMFRQSV